MEENIRNSKYVLTIVDGHSKVMWTYFLSSNDQDCSILKIYFRIVQTQFGKDVKKLMSDNGSYFVNNHVKELLNNLGILHQRSCVYTPRRNDIVERRHDSNYLIMLEHTCFKARFLLSFGRSLL